MGVGIGAEMRPGVVRGEEILEMAPERMLLTEFERRRGERVVVEVEAAGWVTVLSGSGGVVSSSSSS